MSLFTNLIKKSVKEFIVKYKKWIIAFGILIGILIGINLLINNYLDKRVGSLIKEFVHEKSNGFYKVDFNEIAYVLNDGRFFVSEFNFDIHPTFKDNINLDTLNQNYIFSASVPRLHIDIVDFWSVFISRKLKVVGVEIVSPDIKILNLNKNKAPKKISFEARNLYKILSGHLNELRINDFLISEGEFDYETYKGPDYDNFKVKGVTFQIKNLKLSESESKRDDKFFYTDDISFSVRDQVLFLKDSIHKVTFDEFYISTSKNEIGFESFNLTKRENPLSLKKKQDHYEISLPKFRLAGIDFVAIYNQNILKIDSILIDDPTINIKKRTQGRKSKNDTTGLNLVDMAMIFNNYLMIDHFNLNDAYLIFTDETKQKPKTYSIDHISAHLTKLELDTAKSPKHNFGFDFDEVELLVQDYEVTLPDSVNTIKFAEFAIASSPFEVTLKDLSIQPDIAVESTSEKSRIYANIPYLVLSEFDVAKAINMDSFIIKELYLENPEIKIVPAIRKNMAAKKASSGGMFGIHKAIQSFSELFELNKLKILNGKFDLVSPDNSNKFAFDQINFELDNLSIDNLTNTEDDLLGNAELSLSLKNSSVHLPSAKVEIGNFSFTTNRGRLEIDDLSVDLDTTESNQKIHINTSDLLITDINPNEIIFNNILTLDSVDISDLNLLVEAFGTTDTTTIPTEDIPALLPVTTINHLIGTNYKIDFKEDGLPVFSAEDIDYNITKFTLDQSLSDNPLNQFDYEKLNLISVRNYDLFLRKQQHVFESDLIFWNDKTSTFSLDNIVLKPYGNPNNKYDIHVPNITMSGIDLKKVLKKSHYIGNEISINKPVINLKLAEGKQKNFGSLDLGFIPVLLRNRYFGVRTNNFTIDDASIQLHQKAKSDSLIFEAQSLTLSVEKFDVDSTTKMSPDRFLFANDVKLKSEYVSVYHQTNSDFYNINHTYISTGENLIQLNGIYYATNTRNESVKKDKTRLSIGDLVVKDFDFFGLTQEKELNVSEILVGKAKFSLSPGTDNKMIKGGDRFLSDSLLFNNISDLFIKKESQYSIQKLKEGSEVIDQEQLTDSLLLNNIEKTLRETLISITPETPEETDDNSKEKKFLLDTAILKSINIDRILISDSEINVENSIEQRTGLTIPDIWFLVEGFKYDQPTLHSNRILYSDNLIAKFTNLNYVLPDNLLSINLNELNLNSQDSAIEVKNFELIPLVDRYDYAPAKGYQASFIKVDNNSITFDKVDFHGLFNNRTFTADAILVDKLDISVFKDKRIAFPEWQRRPLLQTTLRNLNFKLDIGKLALKNGFISYTEHGEKAHSTGEVFFTDVDATILNFTNDSLQAVSNPNINMSVNMNIYGKGNIQGDFAFDILNPENIHTIEVALDTFDLTELNRILSPSFAAQISTGNCDKLEMSAVANEKYVTGDMQFYYDELKVALLNRETETAKGVGNVLGSFFANTFFIKTNNPKNLVLRKGDVFYERDIRKAVFQYWTRAILSGMVTSIAPVNHKKKIKKMQKENLEQIENQKELANNQ